MELKYLVSVLKRRIRSVLVTTIITTVIVVIGSYFTTPVFTASTTLRTETAKSGTIEWVDYDINYTDRLMNTYVSLVTSLPVLDELKENLKLDKLPIIKAEIIPETELIKISVEDSNPTLAAEAANTLANILVTHSNQSPGKETASAIEIVQGRLSTLQDEIDKTRQEYEELLRLSIKNDEDLSSVRQQQDTYKIDYDTLQEQYKVAVATATASSSTGFNTQTTGTSGNFDLEDMKTQLLSLEKDIEQTRQEYELIISQSLLNNQKTSAASRLLNLKEETYSSLMNQYDTLHLREVMVESTLSVIEPAIVPVSPTKPIWATNILFGFLAGLMGGIVLVFIFESLNPKINESDKN
jgi:capsular polysaccharide biosynthesis protein